MKTLVIHIEDASTDFLEEIYLGIDCTIISDPFTSDDVVREEIKKHDRILMLGHGAPDCLFGGLGAIIDDSHASLLKDKICVTIWCHANVYFEKHNLKGFSSSMFISEVGEARMYNMNASQKQIDDSNYMFSESLGRYINSDNIIDNVKDDYYIESDPVVKFNRNGLVANT